MHRAAPERRHVVDADGEPAPNAWVTLLETGQLAVSDDEGRFRFDRLRPGSYTVAARGPDGKEAEASSRSPGQASSSRSAPQAASRQRRARR